MVKSKIMLLTLLVFFLLCFPQVSALSIVTHVPEKYTDVQAGDRFYFEIEVKYPENTKRKDLRLEYEILDKNGELLAQSNALKAVETQASFIDFIVIPESASTGLHLINVKIKDYEELGEEVSASFHITGSGMDEMKIYFLMMIGAVVFVAILVLINIILTRKDS